MKLSELLEALRAHLVETIKACDRSVGDFALDNLIAYRFVEHAQQTGTWQDAVRALQKCAGVLEREAGEEQEALFLEIEQVLAAEGLSSSSGIVGQS